LTIRSDKASIKRTRGNINSVEVQTHTGNGDAKIYTICHGGAPRHFLSEIEDLSHKALIDVRYRVTLFEGFAHKRTRIEGIFRCCGNHADIRISLIHCAALT